MFKSYQIGYIKKKGGTTYVKEITFEKYIDRSHSHLSGSGYGFCHDDDSQPNLMDLMIKTVISKSLQMKK
jgi:hypothetical protein